MAAFYWGGLRLHSGTNAPNSSIGIESPLRSAITVRQNYFLKSPPRFRIIAHMYTHRHIAISQDTILPDLKRVRRSDSPTTLQISNASADEMPPVDCYDPTYDAVFKLLFGTEANKGILIDFINDLLALQGDQRIVNLSFKTASAETLILESKGIQYDVYVETHLGERFIVEMQRKKEEAFEQRVVYYASQAVSSQLHEQVAGRANDRRVKSYGDIQKVVIISILDHVFFKDTPLFLTHYTTRELEINRHLHNSPEFIFFELKKCMDTERFHNRDLAHMTPVEKWAYFLKEAPNMRVAPPEFRGTPQLRALLAINKRNLSPEESAMLQVKIQDQIATEQKEADYIQSIQQLELEKQQLELEKQQASDRAQQIEREKQQVELEKQQVELEKQHVELENIALKKQLEAFLLAQNTAIP